MAQEGEPVGGKATGRRVVAALIDIALSAVAFVALAALTGGAEAEGSDGGSGFSVELQGGWFVLWAGLLFAYFTAFEARAGGTPGKLAMGMRVVSARGGKVGWGQAAARTALRLVDALPAFYLVGFVCSVSTAKGQRIGDMVAGTLVVRTPVQAVSGAG